MDTNNILTELNTAKTLIENVTTVYTAAGTTESARMFAEMALLLGGEIATITKLGDHDVKQSRRMATAVFSTRNLGVA